RWRWRLGLLLVAGILVMGTLQDVKPRFRKALDLHEVSVPVESITHLASMMWSRVADRGDDLDQHAQFGDLLVRFNQGWIIARVSAHVPSQEPYAEGSTLL